MTLIYWVWHLIKRWPLRSFFARFPEQVLKDLVSWWSPGKHSLIDCLLGDAFAVLSSPFWSTVMQCGARLHIHTLNYRTLYFSVASYLTGGVFVNPYLPVRVTHGALVVHRYNYATPRCRTSQYRLAFILFPSCQYLFLTILVTFDGVVPPGLRAGPMIFYRLSCSLPIFSSTVSLSRLSFYTVWYYGLGSSDW